MCLGSMKIYADEILAILDAAQMSLARISTRTSVASSCRIKNPALRLLYSPIKCSNDIFSLFRDAVFKAKFKVQITIQFLPKFWKFTAICFSRTTLASLR